MNSVYDYTNIFSTGIWNPESFYILQCTDIVYFVIAVLFIQYRMFTFETRCNMYTSRISMWLAAEVPRGLTPASPWRWHRKGSHLMTAFVLKGFEFCTKEWSKPHTNCTWEWVSVCWSVHKMLCYVDVTDTILLLTHDPHNSLYKSNCCSSWKLSIYSS